MAIKNREIVYALKMRNQAKTGMRGFIGDFKQIGRAARQAAKDMGLIGKGTPGSSKQVVAAQQRIIRKNLEMARAAKIMADQIRAQAVRVVQAYRSIEKAARSAAASSKKVNPGSSRRATGGKQAVGSSGAAAAASVATFAGLAAGAGDVQQAVMAATAALGSFAAVAGTVLVAGQLIAYADQWQNIENRLRAVGVASGDVTSRQSELVNMAIRSRTELDSVAKTYSRIKLASKELGISEQQQLDLTETLSKALQISGAEASESAAALLQFSQALGSGVLQGDELRSLRENAPVIAQAIADEFNTTIGGLKQLGAEGKLVSDRVAKAVLNAQKAVDSAHGEMATTFGQATTQMRTALTAFIGRLDQSVGASRLLAQTVSGVATALTRGTPAANAFAAALATIAASGVVLMLKQVAGFAARFAATFVALNPAIAAVVATVATLTAGFVYFKDTVIEIEGYHASLFNFLKAGWQEVSSEAKTAYESMKTDNDSWFNRTMENTKKEWALIKDGVQLVKQYASSMATSFNEAWINIVASTHGFVAGIEAVFNQLPLVVKAVANKIVDQIIKMVRSVSQALSKIPGINIDLSDFSMGKLFEIEKGARSVHEAFAGAYTAEYVATRERIAQAEQARANLLNEKRYVESLKSSYEQMASKRNGTGGNFLDRVGKSAEALQNQEYQARLAASHEEAARLRRMQQTTAGAINNASQGEAKAIKSATAALQQRLRAMHEERALAGLVGRDREYAKQMLSFERQLIQQTNLPMAKRNELMQQYSQRLKEHMAYMQQAQTAQSGFRAALSQYGESAGNMYDNAKKAATGALGSIEDALTSLVSGGKVDVRQLIQKIIAEFMRLLVIRPLLAKLSKSLSGFLGGGGNSAPGFSSGGITSSVSTHATSAVSKASQTFATAVTGGAKLAGNAFESIPGMITNMLKGLGASDAGIAGFLGNIKAESAFRPNVTNGIGAHGLAQWLYSRKTNLFNKFGSNPSAAQQVSFMRSELMGPEKSALSMLRNAQTVRQGVHAGLRYERPDGWQLRNPAATHDYSRRMSYANQFAQNPAQGSSNNNSLMSAVRQQTTATNRMTTQAAQQATRANAFQQQSLNNQRLDQTLQQQQATAQQTDRATNQQLLSNAQQTKAAMQQSDALSNTKQAMTVSQMSVANMTGGEGGNPISGAMKQAAPQVQGTYTSMFGNVANMTGGRFSGIFGSLGGVFQSIFGNVFGGLGNMFQSIFSSIFSGFGGGGGGGLLGGLFSLFGFHSGGIIGSRGRGGGSLTRHVSGIRKFHTGGIIGGLKSGEVPMIGKKNEAVMPTVRLPNGQFGVKAIGAGGSGQAGNTQITSKIQINMNGSSGDKEQDEEHANNVAAKLDQIMEQKLAQWSMNQSRPGGVLYKRG